MREILSKILKSVSIVLLMYIFVSRGWNALVQQITVQKYENTIAENAETELEINAARDYNEFLFMSGNNHIAEYTEQTEGSPSSENYGEGHDKYYESLINPCSNSEMGYLEISCIGVTLPIYHYASEKSLSDGAGHLYGTSLPVGGENTHTVITGHRGMPTSKLFTDLDKIQEGDIFTIHVLGQDLCYQVYNIEVVEPTDLDSLDIQKGEDLATLVTCTPYGVNTERLLVHGRRIRSTKNTDTETDLGISDRMMRFLLSRSFCIGSGFICLAVGIILLFSIWKRKNGETPNQK